MRSTGITRSIDSLGRIVLPKELCKTHGIDPGTPLEFFVEGDTILLRKYQPAGSCVFCGELARDSVEYHGKFVCENCRSALANL